MPSQVPHDSGPHSARSLEAALAAMRWRREPGRFGLLGHADPPDPAALRLLAGGGPVQVTREGGETSVLAALDALEPVRARHPGARFEGPLVWVRFELPMAWELVGFLAHVTGALAAGGVSLGAVCGYSRDHLFVPERHWTRAQAVLERLFGPEAERTAASD